jgi:hypothetical protein
MDSYSPSASPFEVLITSCQALLPARNGMRNKMILPTPSRELNGGDFD